MQSQAVEHIGVAISAMGHSRHKRIIGVGTGDYEDTAWYKKWHQGIQHEWDADAQAWIATSGGDPLIHSYHLPQTIVPWITDADIERAYNTALSRNIFLMEIMGWWVTGVKKPITTSMMEALQDQSMSLVRPEEMHTVRNRGPLVAGIDFGGGTRSHTVFWLGQAIDPDIPVFRLRWVQAIDDKSVEVQADGLIRLLELTDPHIAVMDEGGGTRQLQKIEERFDNVHRCHFAPDRNRPLNTEDLHKYNLVKVNRTHMIESVIDLVSRRHAVPTEPLDASDLAMRPEGQAVAGTRYQIPYAEPGLVDWIVPHFTCIYAKSVKTATGHDYLTYDKEPTAVHDALMACLYSYVGFRILQEQSGGGERAIGRFGSGHRRPYR